MSWFGSSKYVLFEENIEKATSESIPNGDIDFAAALELSDEIRSKQVPPKEAMRILKKRLMNAENLNMQKSAFKLIDFCIKNGGSHFIAEIATKEFMDPLVVMLRNHSINESLKNYILENIQTWSIMVSTNKQFDYINKTYTKLQEEGFEFPAISDVVDPNLIESKVAPEWQDSDACMMCSKMFTFINRKHHCRSCGGVFCGAHSDKTIELPELGINIPVRVCDNCYTDQKSKKKKSKHTRKASTNKKEIDIGEDDDDEIKKAIELSLKESSGTASNSLLYDTLQPTQFDEEDEAMKAAIQASLQDLGRSNKNTIEDVKEPPVDESTGLYANLLPTETSFTYSNGTTDPIHNQYLTNQSTDYPNRSHETQSNSANAITPQDELSILQFVGLVDRVRKNPSSRNQVLPDLLRLQTEMILLNPKINRLLKNEQIKLEKLQVVYSKLFTINKLYDEIIKTKLMQDQEQAQLDLQRQHTLFSAHNSNSPFETYQPPQLAYHQAPHAFQTHNASSLSSDFPKPLAYAQIPTQYSQNVLESAVNHTVEEPVLSSSNSNRLTKPTQPEAESTSISNNLSGLDSLQYAPVPEHNETPLSSRGNSKNEQETLPAKEPEIINLIDL